MEPDKFLDQDEFDALEDHQRDAYVLRFMAALRGVLDGDMTDDRKVDYFEHYLAVQEWTLPPAEFDRLIKTPMWNAACENAGQAVEYLKVILASDELSYTESSRAEKLVEGFATLDEHKRALDALDTTEP